MLKRTCLISIALIAFLTPGMAQAHDDRFVFVHDGDIWSSDSTGTDLTHVAGDCSGIGPCVDTPSESPDGQSVAYSDWSNLYLNTIDGGHEVQITPSDSSWGGWDPEWSPDGNKLIFTGWSGSASGVFEVNPDGTDVEPLLTSDGSEEGAHFSPDGQQIVYDIFPGDALWMANSDGTDAHQIDLDSEVIGGSIHDPQFSPDGASITFSAVPAGESSSASNWEVWTADSDGTNVHRVTNDSQNDQMPTYSPSGSELLWDHESSSSPYYYSVWSAVPSGSFPGALIDDASHWNYNASYRQPSGLTDDDLDAAQFRPKWFFDSEEHWRPLNVDRFLGETDPATDDALNEVCDAMSCASTTGVDSLRSFSSGSWIQMLQEPGSSGEWDGFHTPDASCVTETLLDCNSGPATAVYYTVTPSIGYRYLDYWTFYRYNHFPDDDHQGDWEGVTVAPDPVLDTFDFVAFAQHTGTTTAPETYLRDNLQCDDGGELSCGTDGQRTGRRIWTFVAQGSHAAYPTAQDCRPFVCFQHDSILPEGNHDGDAPWGRNDDPTPGSLLQMPAAEGWDVPAEGNWTDWPGHWGATESPNFDADFGNSPDSPGNQQRFKCPWLGNDDDATACTAAHRKQSAAGVLNQAAASCANWEGSGVSFALCSPSQLARAVRRAQVGRPATFNLISDRHGARAPAGGGIVQQVGNPLRVGGKLHVRGQVPRDAELLVRAHRGSTLYQVRFRAGLAGRLRSATVMAGPGGVPVVRALGSSGTRVLKMRRAGRYHAVGKVQPRPTPRPTRPSSSKGQRHPCRPAEATPQARRRIARQCSGG